MLIDPTNPNRNQKLPSEETSILTPYNINSSEEFLSYVLNDVKQLVRGYEVLTTSWTKIIPRFNMLVTNQLVCDQRLTFIETFLKDKYGYERPEINVPGMSEQTKAVLEQEAKEASENAFPPHPHFGEQEENV